MLILNTLDDIIKAISEAIQTLRAASLAKCVDRLNFA